MSRLSPVLDPSKVENVVSSSSKSALNSSFVENVLCSTKSSLTLPIFDCSKVNESLSFEACLNDPSCEDGADKSPDGPASPNNAFGDSKSTGWSAERPDDATVD